MIVWQIVVQHQVVYQHNLQAVLLAPYLGTIPAYHAPGPPTALDTSLLLLLPSLQVLHHGLCTGCAASACASFAGIIAGCGWLLLRERSHAVGVCQAAVHLGRWLCGTLHVVKQALAGTTPLKKGDTGFTRTTPQGCGGGGAVLLHDL
jgi:hypothetical protein